MILKFNNKPNRHFIIQITQHTNKITKIIQLIIKLIKSLLIKLQYVQPLFTFM